MSLLEVLTIPDKRLRQKCNKVDFVDDHLRKFMLDMVETMHAEDGIGLAANQVGVLKRIITIDLAEVEETEREENFYPLFLINPEYISCSDEKTYFNEGCLSVPGSKIEVLRPKAIEIKYIDFSNKPKTLYDEGFLARVIQHEMDHLEGRVILDYVSKLKRDLIIKKISKEQRL